jgi:DNA-binding transcriptional LysR family regulator
MEMFVRVVETGSFSATARDVDVGQPAISKSIAQLEERLGVKLVARSTRGLSVTEAGQSYYERAKRAIEEVNEADLAARGASASLSGRLRICAAVTFARLHLIPRLPEFLKQHPELDLEVILDDRHIDLLHEGIDVALRMGALADSTLTARRIGTAKRLVVGSPAYFERAGVPVVPEDLAKHEAILYLQQGDTWMFQKDDSESSVTVESRLKVSAAEGVRAAVLAGMGITIGSEWMFSPELKSGTLQAVLTDWSLPSIDLWAVSPAGRTMTAKARAFVSFFEQCLAAAR